MVTMGDVSLDVEDGQSPDEWPHIEDISSDKLKYSVHLAVEPMVSPCTPKVEYCFTRVLQCSFSRHFSNAATKALARGAGT
jgi:hypothetical protein